MKNRISVTIEEKRDKFLDELVKRERYRNKSHAIEEAVKLLEEKESDKNKK